MGDRFVFDYADAEIYFIRDEFKKPPVDWHIDHGGWDADDEWALRDAGLTVTKGNLRHVKLKKAVTQADAEAALKSVYFIP